MATTKFHAINNCFVNLLNYNDWNAKGEHNIFVGLLLTVIAMNFYQNIQSNVRQLMRNHVGYFSIWFYVIICHVKNKNTENRNNVHDFFICHIKLHSGLLTILLVYVSYGVISIRNKKNFCGKSNVLLAIGMEKKRKFTQKRC